ncbi:MAG: hypothetical protein IJS58_02940 [Bacilli bacterium]|nr:hypothetical protein [Bacilli bacterium]
MEMRIIDVINKKNDYDWVEKKVKTILDSLEYCDGNSDKIMLDFCNQYGIEIGQTAKFWKLIHNVVAQQYMKYLNALEQKIEVDGVDVYDNYAECCFKDEEEKW